MYEARLAQAQLLEELVRLRQQVCALEVALGQGETTRQEQAMWLQTVIDTAVDAIIIINEHGVVELCNPAVETLLGYTPAEVIGHNVSLLMSAPDREVHDGYLERYLRTGERHIIGIGREVVGQHKDGTLLPLRLSVSAIHHETRQCFVGMLHDITPYKQAETALRQARDELEERVRERTAALQQANEELRRFATIVSHDLRAPLINLKGFAGELQNACAVLTEYLPPILPHLDTPQQALVQQALHEEIPEALNFINTAVTRMDRLTQAILRLARLGRQTLTLEPIASADVVQEILQTLAHQIAQQHIQVSVGPLPIVQADRTALGQIFGNLLANAVAYLEPGRPGQLRVSADSRPGVVAFHVQDNGRGIAADDLERIFEPFQRVGRQNVPGEGMGLTYVRRLVQRHGGEICCQSSPGVGTTFTFTIACDQAGGALHG
jgi:PAS domain S-box-containing protein